MNKVIMHINFGEVTEGSYGKRTIDDICRLAADIGFDGIEFRGYQPKELAYLSFREYASQIAGCSKKYGLSEIIFGIGVNACASEDKEAREKSIYEAVDKAKIVNDLCGTTLCNTYGPLLVSKIPTAPRSPEFHGSAVATQRDWELTADAYARVGNELEKIGVKFAFETHPKYLSDTPQASKKLVDLIDSPVVGINMDYGNTVYFPNRPSVEETIDIYGDKLFYTHLKNSSPIPGTKARMGVNLADGEINHRAYLTKLREVGFTGPIGIEAPRTGDRIWYAQQDYAYYKDVAKDVFQNKK